MKANLIGAIACQTMARTARHMMEFKFHSETNAWWEGQAALYYRAARRLMGIEGEVDQ